MALPLETKIKLSKVFGFAKTSPTHVSDNKVVSDGYKIEDVEHAMNLDAIQNYLGTKEKDFSLLWDMLLLKVEGKLVDDPTMLAPVGTTETVTIPPPNVPHMKEEDKTTKKIVKRKTRA